MMGKVRIAGIVLFACMIGWLLKGEAYAEEYTYTLDAKISKTEY